MSYTLSKNNSYLFDDDFNIIKDNDIYKLENWYQYLNDSKTPIVYEESYDDFNITRQHAIKIGNTVSSNKFSGFFVSKKYFKFDSNKIYVLKVRLKTNSIDTFKFGIIGLTSRPIVNRTTSTDLYFDEMNNLHRYSLSHDQIVGEYKTGLYLNLLEHYAPINKRTINRDYQDYIGIISGYTDNELDYNNEIGTSLNTCVKLRSECEYFTPYFYLNDNFNITSPPTTKYTNIDYFTIEELNSNVYTFNEIEPKLNINYYFNKYIQRFYVDDDYVSFNINTESYSLGYMWDDYVDYGKITTPIVAIPIDTYFYLKLDYVQSGYIFLQ